MASKRGTQSVPAAETGAISTDYRGTRGMFMPKGGQTDGVKKGSHARGGALAKVKGVPAGDSGLRLPVSHPTANIANTTIGQPNPDTTAAATAKPSKRKTPSPFYGDS
jgi:hypothetical protein